jgi:hypothetical protein
LATEGTGILTTDNTEYTDAGTDVRPSRLGDVWRGILVLHRRDWNAAEIEAERRLMG